MGNSVNQEPMNKSWSLIFRYYSHCLKMHVQPGLRNDFVLLIKTCTIFSPSIISLLLHYLHSPPVSVELFKTNQTKKKKQEKRNFFFFILPLRLSMLQIFLCFFLQMLSPCYALASVAKPISCDRLRCLYRPHHKGAE